MLEREHDLKEGTLLVTPWHDLPAPVREKLLYGLVRACSKRNIPSERLEALVIEIEAQLRARNLGSVASRDIGSLALQGLIRIDEVAYVRFASVYRQFDNVEEFSRELTRLKRVRTASSHGTGPAAALVRRASSTASRDAATSVVA